MAVRWRFPIGPLGWADGPTASTAALVDVTPGTEPAQIPAGIWERGFRMTVHGHGWATSGSATPTFILGLYLAKPATVIASATLIAATGGCPLPASVTQGPWQLDWFGHCRALATPASATAGLIHGRGRVLPPSTLTAFGADQAIPGTYAGRISAGFDTTSPQNLLLGVTLSAITGTPLIACEELDVELSG